MLIVLIPIYIILQALVLWKVRGPWRWGAALPLVGMLPVAAFTALEYAEGSELWLLALILACPIAIVFLLLFWGLYAWIHRRTDSTIV